MKILGADATPRISALAGGVSSDIWRVDLPTGTVCVKRALARLKVKARWEVPTARNGFEWDWIEEAAQIVPGRVPHLIARDAETGCFTMEYLEPSVYPVWKAELRRGYVDERTTRAVGETLAAIHGATADREDVKARFATDEIFHAIRIEPFLHATAIRHPDLETRLQELAAVTARTKRVLVHGDVSPKNILVGPKGPVFLDAECAWYGDPAFDLAFCLNHLLLKCLWTPTASHDFLRAFSQLADAYLAGVNWEPPATVEMRTANLLPALFLARVDGKSPVEYLVTELDRGRVRRVGRQLLRRPVSTLSAIRAAWAAEIRPDTIVEER